MSLRRDNMKTILFSADESMISELKSRDILKHATVCSHKEELLKALQNNEYSIIIAEYDSIASELNDLISNGYSFKNLIVLEKVTLVS